MRRCLRSTSYQAQTGRVQCSAADVDEMDQVRELKRKLKAHRRTNTLQAEVLANLQRQQHSDLCDCTCDPAASAPVLAQQARANQKLEEKCKVVHLLLDECKQAFLQDDEVALAEQTHIEAATAELDTRCRPWRAQIDGLQDALRLMLAWSEFMRCYACLDVATCCTCLASHACH